LPDAPAVDAGGELVDFCVEVSLEDVLDEGIRRLRDKGTWKVWQFGGNEFFEQETFKKHLHEAHLPQDLLHLLPKDDPKGPERPAEAALRQRMTDLLQQVRRSGIDGVAQSRGVCSCTGCECSVGYSRWRLGVVAGQG
jgi:ferredoxin